MSYYLNAARRRADNAEKKFGIALEEITMLRAKVDGEKAIRKKIQEALTKSREEHDDYVERHGGYSGAYDSLTRGLDRINKELPHMAQLAIMSLINTAEIWLKPAEEE